MKKKLLNDKRFYLHLFYPGFVALIFSLFSATSLQAQSGQTLNFDGVDDYVSLNAPIISGDYTKEAWIYASSLTGFPNILSGTGTALFLNGGSLAAGHQTGGYSQLVDGTGALSPNTWYHVAVTYNATTGDLILYKNGVLVATATSVPNYTETILQIGQFAGGSNFSGNIDEVRIWNTVRTLGQINASKDCQLTGDEPGLLAYYDFNQGIAAGTNTTETTLLDRKDACTLYNGTLNGFALTGTTSNWIAPGAPVSGTCAAAFANIAVKGNNNCITSGTTTTSVATNTDFGNYGAVPISRQFVITNTGNATLNITNTTITGANAADFNITNMPAASLAPGDSTTLTISFTPTGAQGLKTATVTIANSDGDEGTYTFAIQGMLFGNGEALDFDGFDDYVNLPFTFSGSYTKEAWIYANPGALAGYPNILSGDATTGTALFLNGGQLAAGHGSSFNQVLDPTPLVANTWYHVAVTYNSTTGTMNLYKNGVLVSTNTAPAYTETMQRIGTFSTGFYFSGRIDEVRFWNVERTAGEITASYNCALNGSEAGLIAYYNFNQGAQGADNTGKNVLNDLHGDCPLNGTLVNFALTGNTSNWVAPGAPLSGSCTTQVPNISVGGNGMCILTGDASPMAGDNTYFGMIPNNTTTDQTFYVRNNGGANLTISSSTIGGADAGSFMIVSTSSTTILPGDSAAIVVRFAPTTVGVKNATITIANNDADEGSYTFAIQGESLSALPVTLLYFKASANGQAAKLVWETSTEVNNAGFRVERSLNGTAAWEVIGYVNATNRSTGSVYAFNDVAPLKGYNAYRLRQVDISGREALSSIDVVNFTSNEKTITVYPNPVKDYINLVFNDASLLKTRAIVTTASGVVVTQLLLDAYRKQIDVSKLPAGLYFIKLENGVVQRILKQ